jgi:16S rRNA G966 N2-methylase RsmD
MVFFGRNRLLHGVHDFVNIKTLLPHSQKNDYDEYNMTCYATFIPGLRDIIVEIVRERLPCAVIHKSLDGAVLFETQCPYDQLNFFCFNNIFACLDLIEQPEGEDALEAHIRRIVTNGIPQNMRAIMSHNSRKFRSFRVVMSFENRPVAVNEKLKVEAERYIARASGLAVNRSRPDAEFWFLYRNEGFSVFMKRLTLRPSWGKSLHTGELPPPLAWILCRLGQLRHGDTVLDPFCGYGSIPLAALKHFHITKFFACDSDKKAASFTAARLKDRTETSFMLHHADFRSLVSLLPEKSVDVIITDPPWGLYQAKNSGETPVSVGPLYCGMFHVFDALLAENGRLVILSAKRAELLSAAQGRFLVEKELPILLSGQKTGIFLLRKQ